MLELWIALQFLSDVPEDALSLRLGSGEDEAVPVGVPPGHPDRVGEVEEVGLAVVTRGQHTKPVRVRDQVRPFLVVLTDEELTIVRWRRVTP